VFLFSRGFLLIFQPPFQFDKIRQHIFFIGMKSVFVICLTAAFTGMVLGLQGYYALVKYGSTAALGSAVSLSLVREMGPVLTAIMVIARAGSAMTAEIGIMRISEQIDALKTMDINPMRFLISPRIAAALVCFPLLSRSSTWWGCTAVTCRVRPFWGSIRPSTSPGPSPAW
jgi:phospholipid/cholesterol/gamma-HCH transport system permease protein